MMSCEASATAFTPWCVAVGERADGEAGPQVLHLLVSLAGSALQGGVIQLVQVLPIKLGLSRL